MTWETDSRQFDEDCRWMRRALHGAALYRTHPNPMVGAVIVRDGKMVGEGYHRGVGTPHAEAAAFAAAGDAARGATIYVTLEPCSFRIATNGAPRIPCADRCVDAGVRRVVCATEDPDARVAGSGFARLRAAGIAVTIGVEEDRAREINAAYLHHRRTGLPYITHKAAVTLDGKIAANGGDSRWITGDAARWAVHRIRDRADAIIVGVGTILADDPALTTRLPFGNGQDAVRVVLDSQLRTPATARVARPGTLVLICEGATGNRAVLEAAGVEVMALPAASDGRVDLEAAAAELARRGLLNVLLESGGRLAASFWDEGLISKALFFIAPKIIGGADAETAVEGSGRDLMREARSLGAFTVRRYGQDVALETGTGE